MYNKPIIIITQKWWKSNTSDCLIETPVMLAAFYGLRRSEAVGLRWDAIDFQQNTITIQHTVIACRLNGSTRSSPAIPRKRSQAAGRCRLQRQSGSIC